jgi:hypothetical protein
MKRFWFGAVAGVLLVGCGADGSSGPLPTSKSVISPTSIRFGADWSVQASAPLVAGEPIVIDFDPARLPSCRGELYGKPAWSISGSWRVNGGEATSFPIAGHSPTGAPIVPVITPPASGALEMWFFNGNAWGCNAWDSRFGNNYHFAVDASADAPGWIGNAHSVISRWTCSGAACESDKVSLEQGFSFDTWARQRAAIAHLYFDVWKAGVTDWDNPELWQELDVRMYYRFGSSGPFAWRWVDFDRRVGNDARYALPLRKLDPLPGNTITDPSACPELPLTVSTDGSYVSTSVELYFQVNGVELRPSAGGYYPGKFEDYASLYAPCLP